MLDRPDWPSQASPSTSARSRSPWLSWPPCSARSGLPQRAGLFRQMRDLSRTAPSHHQAAVQLVVSLHWKCARETEHGGAIGFLRAGIDETRPLFSHRILRNTPISCDLSTASPLPASSVGIHSRPRLRLPSLCKPASFLLRSPCSLFALRVLHVIATLYVLGYMQWMLCEQKLPRRAQDHASRKDVTSSAGRLLTAFRSCRPSPRRRRSPLPAPASRSGARTSRACCSR